MAERSKPYFVGAASGDAQPSRKRRLYSAPRLATVDLEADQVLLKGCKLPSGGGSFSNQCNVPFQCRDEPGS